MQNLTIIGTDVSKLTLDNAVKTVKSHYKVTNNQQGFNKWLKWALSFTEKDLLWVVMEHTGYYSYQFELFLAAQSIKYTKVAALEIKRSSGLIRGKNDKADAMMISEYGTLRSASLKAQTAPIALLAELKDMINLRDKLVTDRSGYKTRLKEQEATRKYGKDHIQTRLQADMITLFSARIKQAELQILTLIKKEKSLARNYTLLLTIKGIGPVTAAYVLTYTDNFTKFENSRKFSCYAGLVPFEHSSGTSLKGKKRVSHYANKKAKALLNLAALVAVRSNPELKQYFERRVAEGKNKMSVLNIIRNKLVDRMFAIIKRQSA